MPYVATEYGPVWKDEKPRKSGTTPEGKLKADCRKALSNWKHKTGVYAKLLKYSGGAMQSEAGQHYAIGTTGVGDMLIGLCGTTLMVETKIHPRKQSPAQVEMQRDWERTKQPYALVYSVAEFVAALDRVAGRG